MHRTPRQHLIPYALLLALALQAMVPSGYMPVAISDGLLQICPRGLTDLQMSVLHGSHHEAHHPSDTDASDALVSQSPWCTAGAVAGDAVAASAIAAGSAPADDQTLTSPQEAWLPSRPPWQPFSPRAPPLS